MLLGIVITSAITTVQVYSLFLEKNELVVNIPVSDPVHGHLWLWLLDAAHSSAQGQCRCPRQWTNALSPCGNEEQQHSSPLCNV